MYDGPQPPSLTFPSIQIQSLTLGRWLDVTVTNFKSSLFCFQGFSPFLGGFVGEIVTSKALYEMCPNKVHCTPHVGVTQGAACRQFLGAMVGGAGGCFVGGWLCIPAGLCYISVWKFELVTTVQEKCLRTCWYHFRSDFRVPNPATFAFFVGIGDDGGIFAYAHHLCWPSICIIPCMSRLG